MCARLKEYSFFEVSSVVCGVCLLVSINSSVFLANALRLAFSFSLLFVSFPCLWLLLLLIVVITLNTVCVCVCVGGCVLLCMCLGVFLSCWVCVSLCVSVAEWVCCFYQGHNGAVWWIFLTVKPLHFRIVCSGRNRLSRKRFTKAYRNSNMARM